MLRCPALRAVQFYGASVTPSSMMLVVELMEVRGSILSVEGLLFEGCWQCVIWMLVGGGGGGKARSTSGGYKSAAEGVSAAAPASLVQCPYPLHMPPPHTPRTHTNTTPSFAGRRICVLRCIVTSAGRLQWNTATRLQ